MLCRFSTEIYSNYHVQRHTFRAVCFWGRHKVYLRHCHLHLLDHEAQHHHLLHREIKYHLEQGSQPEGDFPQGEISGFEKEILSLQIDNIYYSCFKYLGVVFCCHHIHMHGADTAFSGYNIINTATKPNL